MSATTHADLRAVAAVPAPPGAAGPAQYLTFLLGGEMYAVGILAIKEIIEYDRLTSVPMMPSSVRGVINLRGAAVPVVDLAARFGREATATNRRTCIVIVEIVGAEGAQVVGVLVDAVNAVLDIPAVDIEPPPAFGTRMGATAVAGMGKVEGRFVIILDVEQVLAHETLLAGPAPAGH
jgi:purine-binding chemotaxis protein CheW